MIVFDLRCRDAGHVFEIWFGSTTDYEDQRERGLIDCPYCGSRSIDKAVTAARVPAKTNSARASAAADQPLAGGAPPDVARMKAMMAGLAAAQARLLEGSEHVGDRFAEEARSMHLGETDHRSIHGRATPDEARALIDEGVAVLPLPLPTRAPGTDN